MKRIKLYAHRSKDQNRDLISNLGIKENSKAAEELLYLGYEVELDYEINPKTGEANLVAVDGKKVVHE